MNIQSMQQQDGYYVPERCDLNAFASLVECQLTASQVPNASAVEKNVPVYDAPVLSDRLAKPAARRALMAEWAAVLNGGPGVLVLRQAQPDHDVIDEATLIYEHVIAWERETGGDGADHFAAAGSNDRIWNSLQKLCLSDPRVFVRYFAAPAIDAVAEAWLGPNYQMTAQINVVHPGGKAQQAHRDYHLGFQTAEVSATYPAHVHDLSPLMTLQGGIAHCDMPIECGTTKLLPFSQLYRPGYAAWRREDFRSYFEENCRQLPLSKGDAIFFNPALMHAAGENRSTGIHRMVNLLQISSAFGRSMESIDRPRMCKALYGPLTTAWNAGSLTLAELNAVISASAEGYSFPTNLDSDPPVGGLAPETQADLLRKSIWSQLPQNEFEALLDQQEARKRPDG
ncbi:phytanoyl-CoA dioxygenase family protein [Hoeflea sp.]|uniref:phytanoyl-CoA dioxygenase family protein n=1 Tax=Hoeflea sp. TaxID=1940281 RepID=UPI003B0153E9